MKQLWKPQKFFVRYHYQKKKWMVTDQCGHYIGLVGEVIDRPRFHKNAGIATEYLLIYQRSPQGRAAQELILKYEAYERSLAMSEQRAKDVARGKTDD